MAKQISRARSEGLAHNPIQAGTYGSGRAVTPHHIGKIAGTPEREKIAPHSRRHKADGTCKPADGHPGHRIGARE